MVDVKADNFFTHLHILQRGERLGSELDAWTLLPQKKSLNFALPALNIHTMPWFSDEMI